MNTERTSAVTGRTYKVHTERPSTQNQTDNLCLVFSPMQHRIDNLVFFAMQILKLAISLQAAISEQAPGGAVQQQEQQQQRQEGRKRDGRRAHSSGKNSSVRLEVEIWHMVWLRRCEKPAGDGDL